MGSEFCAASAIAVDVGIAVSAPDKHQLGNVLQMSSVRISLTTEGWIVGKDKNLAGKFQRQTRRTQSSCANPQVVGSRNVHCSQTSEDWFSLITLKVLLKRCVWMTYLPQRILNRRNLWTRKVLRRKQTWRRGKTEKKRKENKAAFWGGSLKTALTRTWCQIW